MRAITLLTHQGLWAVMTYRIGHAFLNLPVPVLKHVLLFIHFLFFKLMEVTTGISIPAGARIGPGLMVKHFGCVIISGYAVIGKNCTIYQGVTIGVKDESETGKAPSIGDNVVLGAGCKIIGNIRIGDNVIVGVNSVVARNIPDNSFAGGVPASVVPRRDVKSAETG